jgi:hypothetical protein
LLSVFVKLLMNFIHWNRLMTDFRALCAELLQGLDENRHPEVRYPGHLRIVMARARALLAQPEPQGPSELELEAIELKLWDKHRTKGYMGEEFMYDNDFSAALDEYRAVLARWGRPAGRCRCL